MDTVSKVNRKGSSKACEGPCVIFEHEPLLKDIQDKAKQLSLACLIGGTAGSEEEMRIAEHDAGHQDCVCVCVCVSLRLIPDCIPGRASLRLRLRYRLHASRAIPQR